MIQEMTQKSCRLSTGELRYWEGGPANGPVLLLLHSAFSDAEFSWGTIWNELARKYRVVAPDMPGFGASQAPDKMSLATLSAALRELLEKLGIDRATVVGNSFGVCAAIGLADLHPECVVRLVLVNGTTLPPLPGLLKKIAAIRAFDRALSGMFYRASFGSKAIRGSFPHATSDELEQIRARVRRDGPSNFKTAKGCALHSPSQKTSIQAPATLLWGADDRLTSLAVAHDLAKCLKDSQLVRIERAGHLPQRDQPREFVKCLNSILA